MSVTLATWKATLLLEVNGERYEIGEGELPINAVTVVTDDGVTVEPSLDGSVAALLRAAADALDADAEGQA